MSTPTPPQNAPEIPEILPVLPLNNVVLFPGMFLPLVVSGDMWVKLVDEAALSTKMVGVFMRTQPGEGFDPLALARTGTAALIVRMLRLPHGAVQILVQGQARIQIMQLIVSEPYPQARMSIHRDPAVLSVEVSGLARAALAAFQQIITQPNPSR